MSSSQSEIAVSPNSSYTFSLSSISSVRVLFIDRHRNEAYYTLYSYDENGNVTKWLDQSNTSASITINNNQVIYQNTSTYTWRITRVVAWGN